MQVLGLVIGDINWEKFEKESFELSQVIAKRSPVSVGPRACLDTHVLISYGIAKLGVPSRESALGSAIVDNCCVRKGKLKNQEIKRVEFCSF